VKYKFPAEAGIAAIPNAPKRSRYTRKPSKQSRYVIRLKKGQSVEDLFTARNRVS
jgi:hypothetical protein